MALSRRDLLKTVGLAGIGVAAKGLFDGGVLADSFSQLSVCTQFGNPNHWTWAGSSTPLLEGYSSTWSAVPTGTINFSVLANFDDGDPTPLIILNVYRIGATDSLVLSAGAYIPKTTFVLPTSPSQLGCNLPTTYSLTVPSSWTSGLYLAIFSYGSATTEIPFVVKPATPMARVYVHVPFATPLAYNNWGGSSLYDFNSSPTRAYSVSLNRPLGNFADIEGYLRHFISWFEGSGYQADYYSSIDLHAGSISNWYSLFVTVGHDEYWSHGMRVNVDSFISTGGNAALLAGNICWWQVRFDPDSLGNANRAMTCYKYDVGESGSTSDPNSDPTLKTVHWYDPSYANWPENATTGVSPRLGALWATSSPPRPSTSFLVKAPTHWALAGTGLGLNSAFGAADAIVGYETDGCAVDSAFNVTGSDGSPHSMTVLAYADCSAWTAPNGQPGIATMGVFQKNGTVFVAATTDWASGLAPSPHESYVKTITGNVISTLSIVKTATQRATLPVYAYHDLLGDGGWNFYCSTNPNPGAGWSFDGTAFLAYCSQVGTSVPVYVYHVVGLDGVARFLLSTNGSIGSGWTLDGIAFYAYASSPGSPSVAAVYQYHVVGPDGYWRFLYSTNSSIGSGWTLDGIAFYTPTS